jgi:DNA mismatch repair protein MutS2
MHKLRGASEHAEKVRRAAETRLEEIEKQGSAIALREQEIARRNELLEAEAQRGLEERVREARRSLERARVLVDQLPAERAAALRSILAETESALTQASITERRRAFLDGLDKGELVYIPRYRQRCVVKKVDRDKREVTVKLGSMNLTVPFDEVTWYESL